MSQDACPLPTDPSAAEETVIRRLLGMRRIAVVGMSGDEQRPAHYVPEYLQNHGYDIIPVNPQYPTILGKRSLKSLAELDAPPDVVLVFRRPEFCAGVTEEAITAKAKGVWLQSGIRSPEAERLAQEAGIDFVQDHCMMVEHRRHGK